MPKKVDKEEKARDIGRAALKVFRERGYHHCRMQDIAQAAGIGKGTVYEYFRDKQAILDFVLAEYFNSFLAGAEAAMVAADGPADRLRALIAFAFSHVDDWEEHCAVYVDYFGDARTDVLRRRPVVGIYDAIRGLLRDLIVDAQAAGEFRRDIDPLATAELLLSMYDGLILQGVLDTRGCEVKAIRRAALQMINRSLSP